MKINRVKYCIISVKLLLRHPVLGSELLPTRLHCGPGVDLASKKN